MRFFHSLFYRWFLRTQFQGFTKLTKILRILSNDIQACSSGRELSADVLYSSDSDQKSIFDHDQLIGLQKSTFRSDHRFSIVYNWSFYFPMIDFLIFFWLTRRYRPLSDLKVFTIHARINLKTWTTQSKPWDLSIGIQTVRFIHTYIGLWSP